MSYWTIVENPSQELLDRLMDEEKKRAGSCPDCGASPGSKHNAHCDVARCTMCGGQNLSCDCDPKDVDDWSGLWPGVQIAYDKKLVCYGPDKIPMFDLNRVAALPKN